MTQEWTKPVIGLEALGLVRTADGHYGYEGRRTSLSYGSSCVPSYHEVAMTTKTFQRIEEGDETFFGSMLFSRNVSGTRSDRGREMGPARVR